MKYLLKSIILCAVLCTIMLSTFAQAPSKFNYQGAARDAGGMVLANQNITLRISIIDSVATGATLYTETHSATTTAGGLFSLAIGNGTPTAGSMASILWNVNDKYIKIEMDENGGVSYTDLGTAELLSVPFAMYAASGVGNPGPQGAMGPTGAQGATGPVGLQGPIGPQGLTGAVGAQGPIGATGATGSVGAIGAVGPQGAIGPQGLVGPQGATGPAGSANINGTVNHLVKFTSATAGVNSLVFDDGTNVGIGTNAPVSTTHIHQSGMASMLKITNGNGGQTISDGGELIQSNDNTYLINKESTGFLGIGHNQAQPMLLMKASQIMMGNVSTPGGLVNIEGLHNDSIDVTNTFNTSFYNTQLLVNSQPNANIGGTRKTAIAAKSDCSQNWSSAVVGVIDSASVPADISVVGMFMNYGNSVVEAQGVQGWANSLTATNVGVLGASATASGWGGYFLGDLGHTGSIYNTSDKKLKKNIEPVADNAITKIMNLQPKQYQFRTNEFKGMNLAEGNHFGFIAQEVEAAFPDLVKERTLSPATTQGMVEEVSFKSVNYTELIPILTAAIQEQQKQIEELKKEVQLLKGNK